MTAGRSKISQIVAPLVFLLSAIPTSAQQLIDGFSEMGLIEATVDGTDFVFGILWDARRKRGGASIDERLGTRIITLSGATISSEGRPTMTQLSLSFVVGRDGEATMPSMDFVDGQGLRMPLVVDLEVGSLVIRSFEMPNDDSITIAFQGELVRQDRTDMGNYVVVPGPAVAISGTAHARFSDPE